MSAEDQAILIREKLKDEWPHVYEGIECLLDSPLEKSIKIVLAPKRLNFFQRLFKRIKEFFHGK